MSRPPKGFKFQQTIRMSTDNLTVQDIQTIQNCLFGNPDRAFHFSNGVTVRNESDRCAVIHLDESYLDLDGDCLEIVLSGTLLPEFVDKLRPCFLSERLFTGLPIVYSPDPESGGHRITGIGNPVLRYIAPPPVAMVNKRRRSPYITRMTYLNYLHDLDIKEGRITESDPTYGNNVIDGTRI